MEYQHLPNGNQPAYLTPLLYYLFLLYYHLSCNWLTLHCIHINFYHFIVLVSFCSIVVFAWEAQRVKRCKQFQFCEGEKGSTLRVNCHDVYVLLSFRHAHIRLWRSTVSPLHWTTWHRLCNLRVLPSWMTPWPNSSSKRLPVERPSRHDVHSSWCLITGHTITDYCKQA